MLDIKTPRGQQSVKDEMRAIDIWHSNNPSWRYNRTDIEKPCPVDAVLTCNDRCEAIIESKSRYNLTLNQFEKTFHSVWLITFDKIIKAKNIAESFHVPLAGFLYLVEDDLLLTETLWTPGEGWSTPFKVMKSQTQKTINGGTKIEDNAFINMKNANQWRYRDV